MKNIKRIFAWIGIIILLLLYIITFIVSFIKPAVTSGLLMACIFTTVALPCFLYAIILIYHLLKSSNLNEPTKMEHPKYKEQEKESK